jgi:hypothetical protein
MMRYRGLATAPVGEGKPLDVIIPLVVLIEFDFHRRGGGFDPAVGSMMPKSARLGK